MNRNVLIVLAGGFLIAILVAVMVQAMIGGEKEVNVERVQILVAAKDLSVGHELKEGDLKWQEWPEETMFMGAIMRDGKQQPTEAVDGKLLRSLAMGQPITFNVFTEDDQGNFLSANVEKGMRAVSVPVSSSSLADRLFRPGDFVDVMVTYRVRVNTRRNPEAQSLVNRYASETVMENIRVLAIDTNDTKAVDEEEDGNSKKKKRKKSSKKAVITLEVTPENAERLVLSRKMGDLSFALRSIGDNADPSTDRQTTDVNMSRVMTKLTEMKETTSAIRIYSGDQMTESQARMVKPASSNVDFSVEANEKVSPTIVIDPALLGLGDEDE